MKAECLKYRDYIGSVEFDMDAGVMHGKILFVNDLVNYESDTIPGLKAEFESAVDDYLATCADLGKDPDKPFSGTFNVRIGPKLHREASLYVHQTGGSINEFIKDSVREKLESNNVRKVHHTHEHLLKVERTYGDDEETQGGTRWEVKRPALKIVR